MRKVISVFLMILVLGMGAFMFYRINQKMESTKEKLFEGTDNASDERKAYEASAKKVLDDYVAAEVKLDALSAKIYNVWSNTVSKKSNPETDRYTKDAKGEFYPDAKTALEQLAKDSEFLAAQKEMRELCDELSAQVESLKAPKFSNVTEAQLKNCANTFTEYANTVMNTTGSLTYYSSSCHLAKANFDAACSMMRMSVGT